MKHYQIDFTQDMKITGRDGLAPTVKIESRDYLDYISEKNTGYAMYYANIATLYKEMPDNLKGSMLDRKKAVDYMDICPFCPSITAVISGKMKKILEDLNVSKNEYALKCIHIKGYEEEYYVLFIPVIPISEIIFSKSVIETSDNIRINNVEEFETIHIPKFFRKLTLKEKFKDRELITTRALPVFFSDRIVEAMKKENVIGYEIVTGGYYYTELAFAEE